MAERALNPLQAVLPIFDEEDVVERVRPGTDSTIFRPATADRGEALPSTTAPGVTETVSAETDPPRPMSEASPGAPPALLDKTVIGAVMLRELDRALALYPDWAHPFAGLSFNRARRCYGQAHRDGRVVLSTLFIGTAALEDLEDTVRHEFAHLIVGIKERHGPRWRAVAKTLGAVPRATGRSQSADLNARMDDAPWTLVAILASGEERELKPAFRRNRRFLDYRLGEGAQRYRCAGQDVLRFEYRPR